MVVKRKKILIYWKNKPHYSQNLLNLLKKDFDVFITGKIRGVYEKFKKNKYDIFIFTGWGKFIIFIILFLKFKSVKLVCMVDNTIKKNFKQFIGKLFFILFKKLVDFYFVPGKESEKLLRYFGINKKKYVEEFILQMTKFLKKL